MNNRWIAMRIHDKENKTNDNSASFSLAFVTHKTVFALDYLQSQPTPGELHEAPLVMRQKKISEKKKWIFNTR